MKPQVIRGEHEKLYLKTHHLGIDVGSDNRYNFPESQDVIIIVTNQGIDVRFVGQIRDPEPFDLHECHKLHNIGLGGYDPSQ